MGRSDNKMGEGGEEEDLGHGVSPEVLDEDDEQSGYDCSLECEPATVMVSQIPRQISNGMAKELPTITSDDSSGARGITSLVGTTLTLFMYNVVQQVGNLMTRNVSPDAFSLATWFAGCPDNSIEYNADMLLISNVADCKLITHSLLARGIDSITGTLKLTDSSISFSTSTDEIFSFLFDAISDVGVYPVTTGQTTPGRINIKCKNFKEYDIELPQPAVGTLVYRSIIARGFPSTIENVGVVRTNRDASGHQFESGLGLEEKPYDDGWSLYSSEDEYSRMGLPNSSWRRSDVNSNYEICATYPSILYVPAAVTDEALRSVADYRSIGRIPALSYLHSSGATISRCAQPLKGLLFARSDDDEQLVREMQNANPNAEGQFHIADARPQYAAMANFAKGKGFETAAHYGEQCSIQFYNIHNIHQMRKSLRYVLECCHKPRLAKWMYERDDCVKPPPAEEEEEVQKPAEQQPGNMDKGSTQEAHSDVSITESNHSDVDNDFDADVDDGASDSGTASIVSSSPEISRSASSARSDCIGDEVDLIDQLLCHVADSGWLDHVTAVLTAASCICDKIVNNNESVLVHCSDGWDRSAQLTSLSQLLIDPYYRSIHGFRDLIEKEWLHFGHKFSHRMGLVNRNYHTEISPVFTQFLDCVWQLLKRNPTEFEFTERFLLDLHAEVASCRSGTFLGNCEKNRVDAKLRDLTPSAWTRLELLNIANRHTNNLYEASQTALFVDSSTPCDLWVGLYAPWLQALPAFSSITHYCAGSSSHTTTAPTNGDVDDVTVDAVCARNMGEDVKDEMPTIVAAQA